MPDSSRSRLPEPSLRVGVAMRDGVALDTCIWLPAAPTGPVPAILIRTPYSRAVFAINEPPKCRYLDAGYALVMQQIRGVGQSEGNFSFNAPHEKTDGYDTVEWIAAQDWCDGAVGLDGHSYAGMTQLSTAAAHPPHLRCMVPAVPSADFFLEPPYIGGIFSRMHTLIWGRTLQFPSMLSEDAGAFAMHGFLTDHTLLDRWTSRPLCEAATGELQGDFLAHYQDVLAHPTDGDWWKARTLSDTDYAAMTIPTLLVTGTFDPSTGALTVWRGLEANAAGTANADDRALIIGPWDHNACYNGGAVRGDLYPIDPALEIDLVAHRIAFFDRHLKGIKLESQTAEPRVKVFITGSNVWVTDNTFPLSHTEDTVLYLSSDGHANSSRGSGRLVAAPPDTDLPADSFTDDPMWPFVAALTMAKGPAFAFDMRERESSHDTLVYSTGVLREAITVLGEPTLDVFTSADAPDADVVAFLVEHRADGASIFLAFGQLRLRYREGFDREVMLEPGKPVSAHIRMTYVGHTLAAGSELRLLISGNNFPLLDPNPHVDGPIAAAARGARAMQSIYHDLARPSRLTMPTIDLATKNAN